MSHVNPTTIACPKCGQAQECPPWTSINVTLDPSLKQELLDRRLNRFTCAKCGYEAEIAASFIYHDMAQQVMITINADHAAAVDSLTKAFALAPGLQRAFGEYRFRSVANRDALVEKVLILDANLDDVFVEIVKLLVQGNDANLQTARIFFERRTEDGSALQFVALAGPQSAQFSIPAPFYDEVAREFADFAKQLHQSEQIPRIDAKSISALLSK